jgi:hypothetical protein
MQGLNFRHWYLPAVHIFKKLMAINTSYYPEMLRHVYVVNAPSIFWVMWKLVKPMLDSNTAQKVTVANDLDSIQQIIDPKYLPELYEQPCSCPIGNIKRGGIYSMPTHHLESDHQQLATIVVGRASAHAVPVVAEPGYILRWEFHVENFDVNFGVMCQLQNSVSDYNVVVN